jgi:hypothetical protein
MHKWAEVMVTRRAYTTANAHMLKNRLLDILFLEAILEMTTAVATARSGVRNSPFRESEWDRRLDHLLQDLENSTTSTGLVQSTQVQIHQQASTHHRSVSTDRQHDQGGGYASVGLAKSKSTSSIGHGGVATDNMLKDLDTALKASSNYIESHRTVQMPNGSQEYHEIRSSSTSGTPRNAINDFNLERQVQQINFDGNCLKFLHHKLFYVGSTYDASKLEWSSIRRLLWPPVGQHGVQRSVELLQTIVHFVQSAK